MHVILRHRDRRGHRTDVRLHVVPLRQGQERPRRILDHFHRQHREVAHARLIPPLQVGLDRLVIADVGRTGRQRNRFDERGPHHVVGHRTFLRGSHHAGPPMIPVDVAFIRNRRDGGDIFAVGVADVARGFEVFNRVELRPPHLACAFGTFAAVAKVFHLDGFAHFPALRHSNGLPLLVIARIDRKDPVARALVADRRELRRVVIGQRRLRILVLVGADGKIFGDEEPLPI